MQRDRKWANSPGAEAVRLIDDLNRIVKPWIEAGSPGFEPLLDQPQAPDQTRVFAELIRDGGSLRDACLAVVHQSPGTAKPDRHAFKDWTGTAGPMIEVVQMPLENRRQFATAMASGTAKEIIDAIEAGTRER